MTKLDTETDAEFAERRKNYQRSWRALNATAIRAQKQSYYHATKAERTAAHRAYMAKGDNRDRARRRQKMWRERTGYSVKHDRAAYIRRTYGLTWEQYTAMLDAQRNGCSICRADFSTTRICVDHDHATNRVRALLCHPCNAMLGQAADDPCRLRAAAEYVEKYRAEHRRESAA